MPRGGAFDTRRWGFPHKQVGLLTQQTWSRIPNRRSWATPFGNGRRALYTPIHIYTETMCFSSTRKEGRRDRYNDRYNPVCTPSDLLRTRNFLRVLTISPRICRACRPTPCHHSACKRDAKHLAFAKLRRSWWPSAAFALRLRRFGLAARGRPARADAVA
jgi:hypothetical protein